MKIVCFSSNVEIWYFALVEATIAHALQKNGHEVVYITPGNYFKKRSNPMNEKILRKEFNLNGYEIKSALNEKDKKKINSLLDKITKNNFKNFKINNIKIGKIALYESLLHHKKITPSFSDKEWKEYFLNIEDTLISFFACRKIIKKEKPDILLMYNTLYSVNRVWERYAHLKKIPTYFLHHGLNFSDIDNTVLIAKNNSIYYLKSLRKIWLRLKNYPSSKKMLSYVTDHFLELLKGEHSLVYSAPKSKKRINVRKVFNIKENQKVLSATMSSYDELLAAEYVEAISKSKNVIFNDQVDWVKSLINYVKNKPNLFLIIRVHPREFPNKRDNLKSEHAGVLEKVLKKLPNNVKVNWPKDNLSIYDLAQETDVFLNAWSTVGVEMSLLGIPVVLYSKEFFPYPPDLNYLGKNKTDYFSKIELALKEGWSYEKIKKTFRWLTIYYCRTIVRFRKKKKKLKTNEKPFKISGYFYNLFSPRMRFFLGNILSLLSLVEVGKKQKSDCRAQLKEHINISGVEKMLIESRDTLIDMKKISKNKVTLREEGIFIRNELKRIYKALYNSDDRKSKIKKNSLQYNLKKVIT
ncbi:MAG: hypothetical protein A2182_03095 [Candidatus Pacebacteria bacterium RIFOXYA1_FULL_38_18]|nr:MAG: hypothetical protein A2182_03095 [Candidatus Pacebacteria bacterium RIFOXYA1_FULL_38_18]OGJ39460.1 MAG: hypothetical protein A2411_01735 [Candidatus Pacebacteria bacterium RIFOXYC1_FULL_39_21]